MAGSSRNRATPPYSVAIARSRERASELRARQASDGRMNNAMIASLVVQKCHKRAEKRIDARSPPPPSVPKIYWPQELHTFPGRRNRTDLREMLSVSSCPLLAVCISFVSTRIYCTTTVGETKLRVCCIAVRNIVN